MYYFASSAMLRLIPASRLGLVFRYKTLRPIFISQCNFSSSPPPPSSPPSPPFRSHHLSVPTIKQRFNSKKAKVGGPFILKVGLGCIIAVSSTYYMLSSENIINVTRSEYEIYSTLCKKFIDDPRCKFWPIPNKNIIVVLEHDRYSLSDETFLNNSTALKDNKEHLGTMMKVVGLIYAPTQTLLTATTSGSDRIDSVTDERSDIVYALGSIVHGSFYNDLWRAFGDLPRPSNFDGIRVKYDDKGHELNRLKCKSFSQFGKTLTIKYSAGFGKTLLSDLQIYLTSQNSSPPQITNTRK